ncbi:MAG: hypothetical protein CMH88_15315 [Oceanibulbus sp.]|nr:hypothetical protein [Sulfitobacter sp.]
MMNFGYKVKSFLHSDSGAVTVEWIFLTATLIGLIILLLSTFETAALNATSNTTAKMSTVGSSSGS